MQRVLQTAIAAASAAVMAAIGAGCATSAYTPAPGEPAARLRLVAAPMPRHADDGWHAAALVVRDLSACPAQPDVTSATSYWHGSAPVSLHMPAPPDAASNYYTELPIPAGKLLGLVMFGFDASQSWSCEVRARFMPAAGADYEVEQRWSADGKKCFIDLRTLAADSQGVVRRQPLAALDASAHGRAYYSLPNSRPDRTERERVIAPPQPDLCKLPAR